MAVVHHPPGGFWKIPERQNYKGFNSAQTTNIPYRYTLLIIRIKITESSSPNLVFLRLSLMIEIPPYANGSLSLLTIESLKIPLNLTSSHIFVLSLWVCFPACKTLAINLVLPFKVCLKTN